MAWSLLSHVYRCYGELLQAEPLESNAHGLAVPPAGDVVVVSLVNGNLDVFKWEEDRTNKLQFKHKIQSEFYSTATYT